MSKPRPNLALAIRQVGLHREPHPDLKSQPRGRDVEDIAGDERKASRDVRLCTHP